MNHFDSKPRHRFMIFITRDDDHHARCDSSSGAGGVVVQSVVTFYTVVQFEKLWNLARTVMY